MHGESPVWDHHRLYGPRAPGVVLVDIDTARKQVESLGGRWSGERHDYDEGIVMVRHDPEEHEFCLVQYFS